MSTRVAERRDRTDIQLIRLGFEVSRRHREVLAPVGLKPRQGAILLTLLDDGPTSQQALGEALQIDPSNLVGLLNALEDGGLISRKRDPADRRRHIVEISKRGISQIEMADRRLEAVRDNILVDLSPKERAQLNELLSRVAETAVTDQWLDADDC